MLTIEHTHVTVAAIKIDPVYIAKKGLCAPSTSVPASLCLYASAENDCCHGKIGFAFC